MIINEDLQFAVVGKFSQGWPQIKDMRLLIPKQCDLKGYVNIGLLSNKYVLITSTLLVDYVTLSSKPQFYITHKQWSYPMRTFKWDSMFDPEDETCIGIAWISFPSLPPFFFLKKKQFSHQQQWLESLYRWIWRLSINRSSCASLKVEVDIMRQLPKESIWG